MLPFLKERHEAAMSGPVETQKRGADEEKPFGMLDAIAEDLIEGIHKKDKQLVRDSLEAFLEHLQSEDETQDLQE